MNDQLSSELMQMNESDQANRRKMMDVMQQYGPDSVQFRELIEIQKPIDLKNTLRLVEIIEKHGWPDRSLVGESASIGAFLIIQHAELSYQKKYLPLLRLARDAGEVKGSSLALLEDRILVREGKNQIYGTQVTHDEKGKAMFRPIEDEPNVDQRRAHVGLEPLAEYSKRFGFEYGQCT